MNQYLLIRAVNTDKPRNGILRRSVPNSGENDGHKRFIRKTLLITYYLLLITYYLLLITYYLLLITFAPSSPRQP